jgi:glyoxylase-like metal-dependent hydrolase (beta-lactamase superfamily II)
MEPIVHTVFEPQTSTWQYVVADPSTKSAVIIDPVLDFDPARNAISTKSADGLLALVKEEGYVVEHLLETHAHADHLTAAKYLQTQLAKDGKKPEIGIGKRIAEIQERFAKRYGIAREEYEGAFDKLLEDDEIFHVGEVEAKAVHLPGHTPDHMGYLIGGKFSCLLVTKLPRCPGHGAATTRSLEICDHRVPLLTFPGNIFCGDSIFNSDVGSARCDFPGGNANDLSVPLLLPFIYPISLLILTTHPKNTATKQPPNSSPSRPPSKSTPATTTRPKPHAPHPKPPPPWPSR